MINGLIGAAAATLTTAAALPMSAIGKQDPDAGLELARIMSGIDSNIGVAELVDEISYGIRPQLMRRASDMTYLATFGQNISPQLSSSPRCGLHPHFSWVARPPSPHASVPLIRGCE